MALKNALFEVEFRCQFDSPDDAYQALPFMRSCLHRQFIWNGTFFGLEIFQSGRLLRITDAVEGEDTQSYIGWKEPDIGTFANIRQETVEKITCGITNSAIMDFLGGKEHIQNKNEAIQELERLGYKRFMSWNGTDLTGYYEPLNINVDLMSCPMLKWPCLVEMEKMAATEEEASQCESELYEISCKFQLQERIVKEEPPSLLYARLFGHGSEVD